MYKILILLLLAGCAGHQPDDVIDPPNNNEYDLEQKLTNQMESIHADRLSDNRLEYEADETSSQRERIR